MRYLIYLLLLLPFCAQGQMITIFTSTDTICNGTATLFSASVTTAPGAHYLWKINSTATGTDNDTLVTNTLMDGDTVTCMLTNTTADTILAVSNKIFITVRPTPDAGTILATDTMVCLGATITLSNTVMGGTWVASNNYAAVTDGVVTGQYIDYVFEGHISPGIDTIYYIVTNISCADTARRIITTNAILYAGLYVPDAVCVGVSYDLSNSNFNIGRLSTELGNISAGWYSITGVNPGYDYLYNVTTNACGSDTARMRVNVLPAATPPVVTSLDTEMCVGARITLSASCLNCYFSWNVKNGNAAIAGSGALPYPNGVIAGVRPGLDTVIVYANSSCGRIPAYVTVKIKPPYPIDGKKEVCAGRSVELSNVASGGIWSTLNSSIITVDVKTGLVTGRSPGIDTIYYQLSNGCRVKTPFTVNPVPDPLPIEHFACQGSEIRFPDDGVGVWVSNDTSVAYFDNFFHPGVILTRNKGVAVIQHTFSTGCFTTLPVSVVDCTPSYSVFPNPAKNKLVIMAKSYDFRHFSILSESGQLLIEGDLTGYITEVDTHTLVTGIYIVAISGNASTSLKFVKE